MNRYSASRLLARDLFQIFSKPRIPTPSTPQWTRLFSQSTARPDLPSNTVNTQPMANLASKIVRNSAEGGNQAGALDREVGDDLKIEKEENEEPYHFHVYSHKHNTHVTVTKPNRDALISLSTGNLGFKKSNRGSYDAAYQLGAYVIDKMHQQGLVKTINKLEVCLRGFGTGRDAVIKVLLGTEGKYLRNKIIRVSDATRLKFGGTRSKKPRRLG
ncbi:hypothetical protein OQA88_4107 [Cercophora sp. LCS_1]